MMTRYFKEVGQEFIEGPTELRAAREAIVQTEYAVRKALADIGVGEQPERPAPGAIQVAAPLAEKASAKKGSSLN